MKKISDKLKEIVGCSNLLDSLEIIQLKGISERYIRTLKYEIGGVKKTNALAEDFYSEHSICHASKINLRQLDAASGVLVGAGVLGTFLGLALGVVSIDADSNEQIQFGISSLLSGMNTAFFTSVCGMGFSIIYIFIEKSYRKDLVRAIANLTSELDDKFYIDDIELSNHFNSKSIKLLNDVLVSESARINKVIMDNTSCRDASGKLVGVAEIVGQIRAQNDDQISIIKTISSDVAIELNSKFNEILSTQLQEQVIPVLNNLNDATNKVITHIDDMAVMITTPATEMIQKIVEELHATVEHMINEFKNGIVLSAKTEISNLIESLTAATQLLNSFPEEMGRIQVGIDSSVETMKVTVQEITTSSAEANKDFISSVRDQFAEGMTTIKSTIESLDSTLIASGQVLIDKTDAMIDGVNEAISNMAEASEKAVEHITASIEQSTDTLSAKTEELSTTIEGIAGKMIEANTLVTDTMRETKKVCDDLSGTARSFDSIITTIQFVTNTFEQTQKDFSHRMELIDSNFEKVMNNLTLQIDNINDDIKTQYDRYETMRKDLGGVFEQLQSGLQDYSATVCSSIKNYLEIYSKNLTDTTSALSSTIQQQSEMVEFLIESVNSKK